MKKWEQINKGRNDTKSALIERQYLEPLHSCSVSIRDKIIEADEFIAMIEKRLEQADDYWEE